MDLYDTKSRAAEALVESIFRRARYRVLPVREAQALRIGHEDFSPTFSIVAESAPRPAGAEPPAVLIAVKYRPSVEQFVALENQRRESIFTLARRQWPNLVFVLVTDRPSPGRSCFHAMAFGNGSGHPQSTVDLAEVAELQIFPHNIADHERLLLRLFGLLSGP